MRDTKQATFDGGAKPHSKESTHIGLCKKRGGNFVRKGNIIKCAVCGREFYLQQSYLLRRKCCSKKCMGVYHSQQTITRKRICAACGKEFSFHNYKRENNRKYCSIKCYWVGKKRSKTLVGTCVTCGKAFSNPDYKIYKNRKYCSRKCAGAHRFQVLKEHVIEDMIGFDNGIFTVLGPVNALPQRHVRWITICNLCGEVGIMTSHACHNPKSHGCLRSRGENKYHIKCSVTRSSARRAVRFKDMTGVDNGNFTFVGRVNNQLQRDSQWITICNFCGNVGVRLPSVCLKLKSCGCLGHKSHPGKQCIGICVSCGKEFSYPDWKVYANRKYCSPKCAGGKTKNVTMENARTWRGGRHYKDGYVCVYTRTPEKYRENLKHCYIPEHDVVMANVLRRPLRPDETVHHINGKRDDNQIRNLELWAHRHPYGQRVKDLVREAREIMKLYGTYAVIEDE